MTLLRVLGNERLVERIVGSSTASFKVIYGEISFQLSHFRFHLLGVRLTLMSRQRLLSQDELVQLVSDIEIGAVLVRHKRRINLLRLQLFPINHREPILRPDLVKVREAGSATQPPLGVSLEKAKESGCAFAADRTVAL